MSDMLNKAVEVLNAKFADSGFTNTVKFAINGEGAITVKDGVATIADEDAEMTMTADADVFEEILSGELDGASAFMSGKLSVDGDMGLAMQLGSVLG